MGDGRVVTDLITIVLPVYGRSDLLSLALESVYAQEDTDWRLLIADDGSDMQTVELIIISSTVCISEPSSAIKRRQSVSSWA